MAVAPDAVSSGGANASSHSYSHTVAAGEHRALYIGATTDANSGVTVSGVTYGGTSLTQIGTAVQSGAYRVTVFRLLAPATGTATIQVTLSASSASASGAISLAGVDQDDPDDTPVTGNGSSGTISQSVASAVGDLVLQFIGGAQDLFPATPGTGQTETYDRAQNWLGGAGYRRDGAAGSVVMNPTMAVTWSSWAALAVNVRAAAEGGGAQELDVGRADETDTALGLSRRKARATQAATTTDSAFATARRKSRAAGLAVETEQALSLARLKIRACGTAVETGSALDLARRKIRGCGRADETDTALARPPLGVITLPVGLALETDTAFALEAPQPPALDQPRGGDDRPAHPGWNRKRATLKRRRDLEFTAQIRDLYRELTGDPSTAERAEAIVAAVVPPQPVKGESAAAREAALTARADALRRRADALEADAVQAEIALRLLHRNLRDTRDDDDCAALRVLLAEVL